MRATQSVAADQTPQRVSLADRRKASWLASSYDEPVWIVRSSTGRDHTAKIEFDIRLADGRSLLDVPTLISTVREYAWWVRDPRFSRIDDATTHKQFVRHLLLTAHALTYRNIWSFAHIQPFDIEELIEEFRYGVDAVLHATERVEQYLAKGVTPSTLACRSRNSSSSFLQAVLADCHLPSNLRISGISRAISRFGAGQRGATREVGTGEALPNITAQAMLRWLDPIEQLYVMRRRLEAETIIFKPFAQGASRVASVKGVKAKRTPIPPPALALHLMEHSARWIFERSDPREVATAARAEVLRTATACWILLAAFTARRDGEICELKDGCLRGNSSEGWWLNVYVEKSLRREEWVPIPGIVARAVEILASISARARKQSGTDYLFQWCSLNGEIIKLDPGRHINNFADCVKVPSLRRGDGELKTWHWSPHQFRRFFAVLYFYRFEGASIEALSHHLRHFSLDMTRRYLTTDPEVAALWTDVEWGYMGHVARSIVAGQRSISGAAGERLKRTARRLLDTFRRKLKIVPPDMVARVASSLVMMMHRQGMVLTPKPWVTCSCPKTREAARRAACRRQEPSTALAVGPDFAQAGPTVCAGCAYAMLEASRVEYVNDELEQLRSAITEGVRSETLFGALEAARFIELRDLDEFMRSHARPLERQPGQETEP